LKVRAGGRGLIHLLWPASELRFLRCREVDLRLGNRLVEDALEADVEVQLFEGLDALLEPLVMGIISEQKT